MGPPAYGRSARKSCGSGRFPTSAGILPFRISEQISRRRTAMKRTAFAVAALALTFAAPAIAQNEQFVPANFYWVGPYAPGGSGFGGGIIDYMQMLNERDGGINGVKLTWEKCETECNNARGVEGYERVKKQ